MKWIAAAVLFASGLAAQPEREALISITAVRHWSQGDVTRVAVEASGNFVFRTDHLHNPERVYFDILNSRPRTGNRRVYADDVNDRLLKRIHMAENSPGVTRVVLDLADGVEAHTSQLVNPNRLIVDLRIATAPAAAPVSSPALPRMVPQPAPPRVAPPPAIRTALPLRTDAVERVTALSGGPVPRPESAVSPPVSLAAKGTPAVPPAAAPAPAAPLVESAAIKPAPGVVKSVAAEPALGAPKAARHTASGDTSLVRALGLKIQRVVIDPGHGGHDQGTEGPHGLLEKDLVLDVSLRLGKLIEERMGAEVIYTRSDDTFIPLEGRTALANEKKADLFLSIHANSSPVPRITGVETYYLSLTDSTEAKDLAARENDSSQLSIFELRDLVQQIALYDKLEESKEFANRMQSALFAFSVRSFPAEKNRGVKKAPFVVLIGARMPSVLAEIGFVSNGREEALLKKSEYRQKLAEALYRGVSRYADSLSHFQVAQNNK
jgi:N-acetylmuramoyl-L-alanine amidase